jgi:hypothetical protein
MRLRTLVIFVIAAAVIVVAALAFHTDAGHSIRHWLASMHGR